MTDGEAAAFEDAIRRAGGPSALARAIGASSPEVVTNWRRRGVPAEQIHRVELVTGVAARQLRPDLWQLPK